MTQRNWKDLLKEMDEVNGQTDSLELSESWKAMPRRTEGVANKTNGLYRRSVLPQKILYHLEIEKLPQPAVDRKTTAPHPPNEAVATQSEKLLVPSVTQTAEEEDDSINFSQFLSAQNNGPKTVTSTPYPLRPIDANRSPKRIVGNVQRNVADSPKKLFVPAPTRIPVTTPRTSRLPSDSDQRAASSKQRIERIRMSSPVVSSTVNNVGDECETQSDPAVPSQPEVVVPNDRVSPTSEAAVPNSGPLDEDQPERDDCAKVSSDEDVFLRPQTVRNLKLKATKSETSDTEKSKLSNHSNNSQKSKKSKAIADPLLQNYIKVGESIINRTNSIPLENSSSSSRRRLYRKGDSCNENEIVSDLEPLGELNPVPTHTDGTFTKTDRVSVRSESDLKGGTTGSNQNVRVATSAPKTTVDLHPNATSEKSVPVPEQNDVLDRTQDQNHSTNTSSERLTDVQQEHASSSQQDTDKNRSEVIDTDQRNRISEKQSNKEFLDEIIEDWSDSHNSGDSDDDGHSNESPIRPNVKKQQSMELKVRQVRSKDQNNQKSAPSKTTKTGQVSSVMQRVVEEDSTTEEDELSTLSGSQAVRLNKQSSIAPVTTNANKTGKKEPVHSTQQMEIVDTDSDENEPIVERLPNRNARRLRTKTQQDKNEEIENQPPGKRPAKAKKSVKKNRSKNVDDEATDVDEHDEDFTANVREQPTNSRLKSVDSESEAELPAKARARPKKSRFKDVDDDTSEVDEIEAELPAKTRGRPKKNRLKNADDDGTEVDEIEAELPAKTRGRPKKNRLKNADDDGTEVDEIEAELPAKSRRRPKKNTNQKELPTSKANATRSRLNVDRRAAETNGDNELAMETDDSPVEDQMDDDPLQSQTDDDASTMRSTTVAETQRSKKRKHQSQADDSSQPSEVGNSLSSADNAFVARKRSQATKWEKSKKAMRYDALKPRDAVPGTRHSTRERRMPAKKVMLLLPLPVKSNKQTFRTIDENSAPKRRRIGTGDAENVYSMLLKGSMDKEPPLITVLRGIEITHGLHRTEKNDLIIHHIPGGTAPRYGYFTLEPGVQKRSCRVSMHLDMHVIMGPIQLMVGEGTQTLLTGSFASIDIGTKYSLRNDGENPALVWFSMTPTDVTEPSQNSS